MTSSSSSSWARLLPLPCTGLELKPIDIPQCPIFRIGRGPDNDFRVEHPTISKTHCGIRKCLWDDGSFDSVVDDFSSRGTTFVNGVRVDPGKRGWIKDGDVLSLGRRHGGPAAFKFILPKEDLGEFGKLFKLGTEIGRGAYATVFNAFDRTNRVNVAVKVIRNSSLSLQDSASSSWRKEVEIMKSVQHPNIIDLQAVFEQPHAIYIVLELFPLGSLLGVIQKAGRIDETFAQHVAYQIDLALIYLHANHIVHRDIKPENVLMASITPVHAKVADFGLATSVRAGGGLQSFAGTLDYMAPEIRHLATNDFYSPKVDSWSLGVTVFAMLAGTLPWEFGGSGDSIRVLWDRLPPEIGEVAHDFMRRLIRVEPSQRLSSQEAIIHAWLFAVILPPDVTVPDWLLDSYRAQNFREQQG
ncbi:kinase-like protein [Artomyces pyxidatus]|uniref:Kinase-like protein n=1 Tax=Artomyces pyxidatus TaxID=48021 RepID=A0ACB8SIN9_9AGAM|nr:kinase-like protein [Artomyces pyxidatus]